MTDLDKIDVAPVFFERVSIERSVVLIMRADINMRDEISFALAD